SSDSGVTWSANTNAPSANWGSVASSADGTKLVAGSGGQISTSGDLGSHWSVATNGSGVSWFDVPSSAGGTKLVEVGGIGTTSSIIYTSTNSGATWSTNGVNSQLPNSSWRSVASSADGTKLVAGLEFLLPNGSALYTSTNSGAFWNLRSQN